MPKPPNYTDLKKLDEDTLKKLKEGSGPVDECLCSILAPPLSTGGGGKGFGASIKRAIGSLSGGREQRKPEMAQAARGGTTLEFPISNDGKGWTIKREEVKRKTPCGRCGCDKEKLVLKHAIANIRVTTPDISTFCPCPGHSCLPGKENFKDDIQVTVERAAIKLDPDTLDSETDLYGFFKTKEQKPLEPNLSRDKRSVTSLIEESHDDEYKSGFYMNEDLDNWSDTESNNE